MLDKAEDQSFLLPVAIDDTPEMDGHSIAFLGEMLTYSSDPERGLGAAWGSRCGNQSR